ncbi:MAG: hypothetical protein GY749_22815 [Desulfobacteraceae bacterium]|nr:hypothetical protein [Desulfobacteraceae bacterium]
MSSTEAACSLFWLAGMALGVGGAANNWQLFTIGVFLTVMAVIYFRKYGYED